MALNRLDNFIKNVEGRILYVNPNDLDSTDAIDNQGNSLTRPFKTIQRALLEAARFSYQKGDNNDLVEKTTILLFPGEHVIDNRPGFAIYSNNGVATIVRRNGVEQEALSSELSLGLDSNFDITQEDNVLYKFNSYYGGVVVPRGTSIVGLDLRKTKLRPKYVPNPTDPKAKPSAIFRITGACYFWQFSLFDGDESGLVYTDPDNYSDLYKSLPTFSHHKLTCFEYCDGVNKITQYGLTDLDMYYSKVSNAYNAYRDIDQKFPQNSGGFAKRSPEWEIVGAFASDPIKISSIFSGNGSTASSLVTVTTLVPHNLNQGAPIKIRGVSGAVAAPYNVSTKVQSIITPTTFTYLLPSFPNNLTATPSSASATVTVEVDTVTGASPYIFNCSLRSVWGMNGMLADGYRASGFRSMVVAQFTAVSLQKDDRAFAKYNNSTRQYTTIDVTPTYGAQLATNSSQTNSAFAYHLDSEAIYRNGWETSHIKITNNAFIQIVSVFAIGFNKHFDVQSGGDASITNSNSNFGQISLSSEGFRNAAFEKDNKAFITSFVTPREVDTTIVEDEIPWLAINVDLVRSAGITTALYLTGFNSPTSVPLGLIQGYRIGAKENDHIYVKIDDVEYSARILMSDQQTSSFNVNQVSDLSNNLLQIDDINTIETGEKILLISESGDLPENVIPNRIYYAIKPTGVNNRLYLASSINNAFSGDFIRITGGSDLKIYSRVSDKDSGEIGSPIQYDSVRNNWYLTVDPVNNTIAGEILRVGSTISETTDLAYIKRFSDNRSLDERIYKVRVVIPKEYENAKNPESGFVLQESSTTGYITDADSTKTTITEQDYDYKRNLRLISSCTVSSNVVTVTAEIPHNLNVGDTVIIENVKSSTNPYAIENFGYNGTFKVTALGASDSIGDKTKDIIFRYSVTDIYGEFHNVGTFTNNTSERNTLLPRFKRNDLQNNLYIYRNEVISQYIQGIQDGIYYLYVLNADNAISNEFTNLKFSQSPVDLYPQLDRDNILANPPAAKSFAKASPVGDVVTSDLKKSITRESIDKLTKTFGSSHTITDVISPETLTPTIVFERNHGLNSIVTGDLTNAGAGYNNGTFYNVKLLIGGSSPTSNQWKGATAKVKITSGVIESNSIEIISKGSNYVVGDILYFDQTIIGTGSPVATFTVTNVSGDITNGNVGDVVQITGIGVTSDGYYRIGSITDTNSISIARTTGDPKIISGQYAFVVGKSVPFSSASYDAGSKILTVTCSSAHGLLSGNKFRIIDSSNNNLGDYVVKDKVSVTQFTCFVNNSISVSTGYILKHAFSSNEAISDTRVENFGVRNVTFYDGETLTLSSSVATGTNTIPVSGTSIRLKLSLGSYIQIDNEIMRITEAGDAAVSVIRGSLGTRQESHTNGSVIRKINPIPIEFRRPSILRASGHTFEYLGYGPGNYSTGLPQVQVKTITERESFLVQSQERSCGIVVYNGINNSGDVFSGNTKTSSSSGEVISFDIPIATVTGQDPSKASAVFDEVTIKERLVVEGGNSGTVLSQFDGPVTFNKELRIKDKVTFTYPIKVSNLTKSTSKTTGALTVTGGVGIGSDVFIGGKVNLDGSLTVGGNANIAGILTAASFEASVGGLKIKEDIESTGGSDGLFQINNTTNSGTFRLNLKDSSGTYNDILSLTSSSAAIDGTLNITSSTTIGGSLSVSSTGSFGGSLSVTGSGTFTGSGSFGSTLSATGNVTFGSNLNVTGETTSLRFNGYGTVPLGGIIMWRGSSPPPGWSLCDGSNGTPDLRGKFIVSIGGGFNLNAIGGSANAVVVSHTHTTQSAGSHNHTATTGTDGSHRHFSASNNTENDTDLNADRAIARWKSSGAEDEQYRLKGKNPPDIGRTSEHTGHTHSVTVADNGSHSHTVDSSGEPGTGKNLPPYYALAYIMRVL